MKEDILNKLTGVYVNKETHRNAANKLPDQSDNT
jgi:hypothetical protein